MITVGDRCELRLFEIFLCRRAEKPDEPLTHAYAEIYGEVVFEDADERRTHSAKDPGGSP